MRNLFNTEFEDEIAEYKKNREERTSYYLGLFDSADGPYQRMLFLNKFIANELEQADQLLEILTIIHHDQNHSMYVDECDCDCLDD